MISIIGITSKEYAVGQKYLRECCSLYAYITAIKDDIIFYYTYRLDDTLETTGGCLASSGFKKVYPTKI